jgi:hypothetical protein
MILRNGIEFIEAEPQEVWDHLNSLKRETIIIPPGELHFSDDDKDIILDVFSDTLNQYPIRQVCLDKMLKWFRIPNSAANNLSLETIVSMLNDLLFSIRSKNVLVKIENGEVVTVASDKYTDYPDLTLLNNLTPAGISSVSRNDYMMSVKGHLQYEIEPHPGDSFGVGISIMNSETGFRSLEISNYLLRYICSNGCYIKSSSNNKKIVHYKKAPEEMQLAVSEAGKLLQNDVMRISYNLLTMKREITEEERDGIISEVRKIVGSRAFKNYPVYLEGVTQYTVFNSITDYAKSFDMQTRLRLEEYAGNMISLN